LFVAAVFALAETVRTERAVVAPGTIDEGANEQVRFLDNPEHVRAIASSKDTDAGVTFTVNLPELPGGIVSIEGEAPKLSDELEVALRLQCRETLTADDM
jgi:hypothetical protein